VRIEDLSLALDRREAFDEIDRFDESSFMFNEDVDLCFRLRRAGWETAIVPSATFVHIGGGSTRSAPDEMYREQLRAHLRLRAKCGSVREAASARRRLVAALRIRGAIAGGARERSAAAWFAAASMDELLRRSG